MHETINHLSLKKEYQSKNHLYEKDLKTRLQKSLSWFKRAEKHHALDEEKFIFLWISLNGLYEKEGRVTNLNFDQRSTYMDFFQKIRTVDSENQIYKAIWKKYSGPIRAFLKNHHVFGGYRKFSDGFDGFDEWQKMLDRQNDQFSVFFEKEQTLRMLSILFERLYILRNQVFHGRVIFNSAENKHEIRDGAAILQLLLPIFLKLVMENHEVEWNTVQVTYMPEDISD